jgi:hypothetical protein
MSVLTLPVRSESVPVPTLEQILHAKPSEFVLRYADIAAINLACAIGLPRREPLDIPKTRSQKAAARKMETRGGIQTSHRRREG